MPSTVPLTTDSTLYASPPALCPHGPARSTRVTPPLPPPPLP